MHCRRIWTAADTVRLAALGPGAPTPPATATERYMDALVKLIPPEIVAAFLAIDGLVNNDPKTLSAAQYWAVFGALVALCAAYVRWTADVAGLQTPLKQIFLSTLGFVVWAWAIGGPFEYKVADPNQTYSSIAVILYTLIVPLLAKR